MAYCVYFRNTRLRFSTTYATYGTQLKNTTDSDSHGVVENIMAALPQEVMNLILIKLDLESFHRFSAVCRSWLWIAVAAKRKIPWFFSLYHGKVFRLELPPEVYHSFCCGSNWGWLIMKRQITGQHFLLNPLSRVLIGLPPAATALDGKVATLKAILLPPPAAESNLDDNNIVSSVATGNCVVMAIFHNNQGLGFLKPGCLAFCRPGDEKWIVIKNHCFGFQDVIFYHGKVYAITCQFDLMLVEFDSHLKGVTSCNIAPPQEKEHNFSTWGNMSFHLVECLGELFVVIRCHLFLLRPGIFKIFKLDPKGKCWIKVENLGDHDQMLFFSSGSTVFSLSALDYSGFKGNSIYFFENGIKDCFMKDCYRLCEFCLEDGSIACFHSDYSHSFASRPIWFRLNKEIEGI